LKIRDVWASEKVFGQIFVRPLSPLKLFLSPKAMIIVRDGGR